MHGLLGAEPLPCFEATTPIRAIRAQGNEPLSIVLWATPQLHFLLLWAGTSASGEGVHGLDQEMEGSQGYGHENKPVPGRTGSWGQATKTYAMLVNLTSCIYLSRLSGRVKKLGSEAGLPEITAS